jgi:hypothetical protein
MIVVMNTVLSTVFKSFWCATVVVLSSLPILVQTARVSLDRVVVQTVTITDSAAMIFS